MLNETVTIAGINTRAVEEREWVNNDLVEVSRNFVVQASDGSVCYFGEEVDGYREGVVVGHGRAWQAGEKGARLGILMPANPEVGTSYHQEFAPGVADDMTSIVEIGQPFTTPAGRFDHTLLAQNIDPLTVASIRGATAGG